ALHRRLFLDSSPRRWHAGPAPAAAPLGPGEARGGLRPAVTRVALPPVLHRDAAASREAPAPPLRHRRLEPRRYRLRDRYSGPRRGRGGGHRALHPSQGPARCRRGGRDGRRPHAAPRARQAPRVGARPGGARARHHALPRRGAAHERGDAGAPPRDRRDGPAGRGRPARDLRPGAPRAGPRGADDGPALRPAPARGGRAAGRPATPRPSTEVRRVTGTRHGSVSRDAGAGRRGHPLRCAIPPRAPAVWPRARASAARDRECAAGAAGGAVAATPAGPRARLRASGGRADRRVARGPRTGSGGGTPGGPGTPASAGAPRARPFAGPGARAYRAVGQLLAVARRPGCDAVHPGYGFLSEQAGFARRCAEAGLTFVGPRPETLALLGDKVAARALAERCGVPVLRGTSGPASLAEARAFLAARGKSEAAGVKAVAGGGWRRRCATRASGPSSSSSTPTSRAGSPSSRRTRGSRSSTR